MTEESPPGPRRRIERGEGELASWPRGLVSYVSEGTTEGTVPPEEDRTANRFAIAARLIGVLRSRGVDVDRELEELRAAERAYAADDRATASRIVDSLLGRLGRDASDTERTESAGDP